MDRIGRRLVTDGIITQEQLDVGLRRQRREGGYLGHHLIDAGFVSRRAFYDALARHWQLEQRDLVACPPDPTVLARVSPEESIEDGWVPCGLSSRGRLVVATAVQPGPALIAEVRRHFPDGPIDFVACTQRDLDHVAVHHPDRIGVRAEAMPEVPEQSFVVQPVHHLWAAFAGITFLATLVFLPVDAVAVLVVVSAGFFLAGVSVQATLGLAAFSREISDDADGLPHRRTVAPAPVEDRDLPTYTVLVRVQRPAAVAEAMGMLHSLDYPRTRLDAVLLVDEDDPLTLAAVGVASPPEWVRVVRIPSTALADRFETYDHGLALARGRYVVVFRPDERPDPGQLRQAVHDFEIDHALRAGRTATPPLLGLRATRLLDPTRRSPYARLATVDDGLRVARVSNEVPAGAVPRDLGSTHFTMRLLRRLGGFRAVHPALDGLLIDIDRPRVEVLDSVSVVRRVPGPLIWTHERAQSCVATVRIGVRRLREALRTEVPDQATACHALLSLSLPMMFWSLPVLLECALVVGLRSGMEPGTLAERAVWLGMGEALMAMVGAGAYVGVVLARRHGRRAVVDLVVLPLHWLLASGAMWAALLTLGLQARATWAADRRRRRERAAAARAPIEAAASPRTGRSAA